MEVPSMPRLSVVIVKAQWLKRVVYSLSFVNHSDSWVSLSSGVQKRTDILFSECVTPHWDEQLVEKLQLADFISWRKHVLLITLIVGSPKDHSIFPEPE